MSKKGIRVTDVGRPIALWHAHPDNWKHRPLGAHQVFVYVCWTTIKLKQFAAIGEWRYTPAPSNNNQSENGLYSRGVTVRSEDFIYYEEELRDRASKDSNQACITRRRRPKSSSIFSEYTIHGVWHGANWKHINKAEIRSWRCVFVCVCFGGLYVFCVHVAPNNIGALMSDVSETFTLTVSTSGKVSANHNKNKQKRYVSCRPSPNDNIKRVWRICAWGWVHSIVLELEQRKWGEIYIS